MTENIDIHPLQLISDQLLEAYADGQLDSETERRVASLIASDSALRNKVLHAMALHEGLRWAVEERSSVPLQPETYRFAQALSAKYAQSRRRRVPRYFLGIAASFALVGLFGAIWAATIPSTDFKRAASILEAVENKERTAKETSNSTDQGSSKAVQVAMRTALKDRDNESVPEFVPTFSEWGFSLVENRLIEGKAQGAVHLLYESKDGRRVSLYYNSVNDGGKRQVFVRQEGLLTILFWHADDRAFSMIGEADRNELLNLARTVTAGLSLDQHDKQPAVAPAPSQAE